MQISNSSLSQFISSTVNHSQYNNRPTAKPITIEGQIADNEKAKSTDKQAVNSVLEHSGSESQTQLIQPPSTQVPGSGDFSNTLLFQEKSQELSQNLTRTQTPSFISQNDLSQKESSPASNSFPYANRRSFEGLAGSSLVIQQYLNNESSASSLPGNVPGNINFFV
ncbi:MAG: hypothetical protein KZQ70_09625 [gamma proteobacterium symbiont of Lucinoma myriamae]|nr:hypothetical protein [gamma proteobacterium symbiont of Lucinoma myriamae]MCU7818982.1 hypothetical protein [gamma proteobacterium symbiont of Lucinoma myriamae]MCU7832756.1 hypothetical protein [gamma proteobacterium symbiont of Lucinoma myriamae]